MREQMTGSWWKQWEQPHPPRVWHLHRRRHINLPPLSVPFYRWENWGSGFPEWQAWKQKQSWEDQLMFFTPAPTFPLLHPKSWCQRPQAGVYPARHGTGENRRRCVRGCQGWSFSSRRGEKKHKGNVRPRGSDPNPAPRFWVLKAIKPNPKGFQLSTQINSLDSKKKHSS